MTWLIFAAVWFVLVVGIIVFNMGAHRGAVQSGEAPADPFADGSQLDADDAVQAWQELVRNSSATTLSRR